MKPKQVMDMFGGKHTIDEETKEVLWYKNCLHRVYYGAYSIIEGKHDQYVTFFEEGTVDTVRYRLHVTGCIAITEYAKQTNFDSAVYDPRGKLWERYVQHFEEHQEKFFDEYGDWKRDMIPDEEYEKTCNTRIVNFKDGHAWYE